MAPSAAVVEAGSPRGGGATPLTSPSPSPAPASAGAIDTAHPRSRVGRFSARARLALAAATPVGTYLKADGEGELHLVDRLPDDPGGRRWQMAKDVGRGVGSSAGAVGSGITVLAMLLLRSILRHF